MGEFVVTVTFSIKEEHRVEFRKAMLANAADSIALEPGCRLFEVCEAADGPRSSSMRSMMTERHSTRIWRPNTSAISTGWLRLGWPKSGSRHTIGLGSRQSRTNLLSSDQGSLDLLRVS